MDGPETRAELAQFQGMVARFDRGLGGLLDLIDSEGLARDTLLVVTTDHGLAMPMAKGSLRDPGLETLLLMRYPAGGWGGGRRVPELVSNVDILPTLLEAVGLAVPPLHGRSFLPLLQQTVYTPTAAVFAEKTFHDCYDPMRCVRTSRLKYVRYFEKSSLHTVPGDIITEGACRELGIQRRPDAEELFDLAADPGERVNLAADLARQDEKAELKRALARWMVETDDPLARGPVSSPFFTRALADLGLARG